MAPAPHSLLTMVSAVFGLFAWAWIGIALLSFALVGWSLLRSRRSSTWIRTPEEVARVERATSSHPDHDELVA